MTPPRPDAPLRLRDAARLAGMSARKLKRLLRDYEMVHGHPFMHRGSPYVFTDS